MDSHLPDTVDSVIGNNEKIARENYFVLEQFQLYLENEELCQKCELVKVDELAKYILF